MADLEIECGLCGKADRTDSGQGVCWSCRRRASRLANVESDISALRAENENLREQLRRIEWINFGGACSANCPECGLHKKDGHHKSCGLAALLAKKGGA